MPNFSTHAKVGVGAGMIAALPSSRTSEPAQRIAELLGGAAGGFFGAALPNLLEPATSPNHRALAHSLASAGTLLLLPIRDWQDRCRARASVFAQLASAADDGSEMSKRLNRSALTWSFLARAIPGLVAGYISHLLLDGATPRGLPIIGVKFT